jgi:phospholipid/cholesterol/gamma-HCH transport system permease protein
VIGIYGGYAVAVQMLGLPSGTYFSQMEHFVLFEDILAGIYKSVCFGIIISWVCCFKGFTTDETGYGAEGVSKATTEAVVMSSILVLVSDYIIGSFLI